MKKSYFLISLVIITSLLLLVNTTYANNILKWKEIGKVKYFERYIGNFIAVNNENFLYIFNKEAEYLFVEIDKISDLKSWKFAKLPELYRKNTNFYDVTILNNHIY